MAYISPLFCLPALEHWVMAAKAGHWRIEACENFVKSSDRNRFLLHSHQDVFQLSMPISGGRGLKSPIRTVHLDNSFPWRNQHLQVIQNAYAASPFFEDIFPEIEAIYTSGSNNLFDFNLQLFHYCLEWVTPKLTWSFTEAWEGPYSTEAKIKIATSYFRPHPLLNSEQFGKLSILDLLFHEGPWSERWLEDAVKFS